MKGRLEEGIGGVEVFDRSTSCFFPSRWVVVAFVLKFLGVLYPKAPFAGWGALKDLQEGVFRCRRFEVGARFTEAMRHDLEKPLAAKYSTEGRAKRERLTGPERLDSVALRRALDLCE